MKIALSTSDHIAGFPPLPGTWVARVMTEGELLPIALEAAPAMAELG